MAERTKRDEDEIDPDAAPPPQEFKAPKGLLKAKPEPESFDVQSGAGAGKRPVPPPRAPAAPPGTEVRAPPPTAAPRPPPLPPEGEVDVRFQKSTHGPRAEDVAAPGEFDVQMQRGRAKLPRIEAPGEFDVVKKTAVAEPKPAAHLPQPLEGEVEVVDYRKSGPVDVSGQVPDPFATRRRVGVVDTTFARVDMGREAIDVLETLGGELEILRRTVPGVKDLAVEAKVLIEKHGCEVVVACGMVGAQPVDKTCAHEASLAIQSAQLATNRHILEVFVHEDEASDEAQLSWLMRERTREHAENAWRMLLDPEWMVAHAGQGLRQGFADAGPIVLPR